MKFYRFIIDVVPKGSDRYIVFGGSWEYKENNVLRKF